MLTLALALLLSAPEQPPRIGNEPVASAAARLRPGQFLWLPRLAPAGPTIMVVNVRSQRAVVYRNGIPIGITTVSTGRPGHETPLGLFAILQKDADHHSSLYDDAPMPYMQRLTWGGVALHGGVLPGFPASHGCIRLPVEFAKELFAETKIGMLVIVTNLPALPTMAMTNAAPLLGPAAQSGNLRDGGPVAAPLSIIVSTTDHEVRVIRNGEEIGAAPVTLRRPITFPSAYQLQAGGQWLRIPLPGQSDVQIEPFAPDDIIVADEFRQRVLAQAAVGTTVVITPDALRPDLSTAFALIDVDQPR